MAANAELLNKIATMVVDGIIFGFVPRSWRSFVVNFFAGKIKPVIDSVYKFDDVYGAYDKLMTTHARGKVVIEVA